MGPLGPHLRRSLGGARRQVSRPLQGRGDEGGGEEQGIDEVEKEREVRREGREWRSGCTGQAEAQRTASMTRDSLVLLDFGSTGKRVRLSCVWVRTGTRFKYYYLR